MAGNWTREQLEAITQRGCNLLVAAAAGAGKTAVLVERIIRKITDGEKPADIDRLLVVTFTNAAATEMRDRIGDALADALEADPSSANLQKQMALLDRASIMTLHSFCLEIVRGHFHDLDLDPASRIADETEAALMKQDVLEELFEDKYENEDGESSFFKLVESYGGGRDDHSLREIVLALHRFTGSHPWPRQWLAAQAEAYNAGASACLSSTPWARVLLKSAAAELQGLTALLGKAAAAASRAQGLEPYCGVLEEDLRQLDKLLQICRSAGSGGGAAMASSAPGAATAAAYADEASAPLTVPSSASALAIKAAAYSAPSALTVASDSLDTAPASVSGSREASAPSAASPSVPASVSGSREASAPSAASPSVPASASGAAEVAPLASASASPMSPASASAPKLPAWSASASEAVPAPSFDWDAIHAAFSSFEPARLPRCGKNADKDTQEEIKAVRSLMKEKLKKLYESGFNATEAEIAGDFEKLYPLFKYLSDMVCEFDARYSQKKREKGLLDFNDLEHYCLRVLLENGRPTAAARELREKYEEILVDEYQDSNLIQELILGTVSGNEEGRYNLFMVGDVKQSIYRFRQARPELFLSKYAAYPHESGYDSRVIQLYKNFRSRPEVIHGVNFIFKQIMSSLVGELDYTDEEALNPGAVFEEPGTGCNAGGPIELHIIDVASAQTEIPSTGQDGAMPVEVTKTEHDGKYDMAADEKSRSIPAVSEDTPDTRPSGPAPAAGAALFSAGCISSTSAGSDGIHTAGGSTSAGSDGIHTAGISSTSAGSGGVRRAGGGSTGAAGDGVHTASDSGINTTSGSDANTENEDNSGGDSGIDLDLDLDEEPLDNIQTEARIVGKRIRSLVSRSKEGLSVYDKKLSGYRPAEYRDIVILMRATRNWADIFTDELAAMGIPAYADTGLGYFRTVEVETMLSLLQIIDNPLQDIPLIAVLRSPIGNFTEDQLADIRLADRSASFYEAMKAFSNTDTALCQISPAGTVNGESRLSLDGKRTGPDSAAAGRQDTDTGNDKPDEQETTDDTFGSHIQDTAAGSPRDSRQKTGGFLQRLEAWRDDAQVMPTDELVWKLLIDTGYYSYAGVLPGGSQRQANLRMLFERARQYEETSYKGLFNFISFIGKLRSGGGDMGSAKILGENDNVVRIMSIHKSKGLEFPVVIVAGCGKKFNMRDLNASILLHQDLGFGPDLVDLEKRTVTLTLPKSAIRQKLRLETLSEEMRILYVAFTRAKEKLIITGCVRDAVKTCARWSSIADTKDEKLPQYDMQQASTYLDWLGPAAARHESAKPVRRVAALCGDIALMREEQSRWEVKLWGAGAVAANREAEAANENIRKWLEGDETQAGAAIQSTGTVAKTAPINAGTTAVAPVNAGAGTEPAEESLLPDSPDMDRRNCERKGETIADSLGYAPEQLIRRLEWQYPYRTLSAVPAKLSVTELKRRFAGGEQPEEAAMPFAQPMVARPLFMEPEKGLDASGKGTVMHFVMQHIDLKRLAAIQQGIAADSANSLATGASSGKTDGFAPKKMGISRKLTGSAPETAYKPGHSAPFSVPAAQASQLPEPYIGSALINELQSQLSSMAANEQLTAAEAEAVDITAIDAFFNTALGKRMLNAAFVNRETAFNIEIKCTEIYKELPEELYGNETMLLQGVIDCWFEAEDGLVLLDYKTDHVPTGGAGLIRERYRVQLDYYTRALEEITGRKVTEEYLYLFHTGELLKC